MADETYTKADIDAAVKAAVEKAEEGLKAKRDELMDEVKKLKADLRKTQDIKPEDLQAAEDRADKAEARVKELEKAAKDATKAAETAQKALEQEQGAARAYAMEAEISSAIAAGNVVPALVPAFKAMVQGQAKAELVDGKYSVSIGDKPAKDYITEFLGSEDGKAFKSAAMNGGGGAPGGKSEGGAKTMQRAEFDAMDQAGRAAFVRDGGKVLDTTA